MKKRILSVLILFLLTLNVKAMDFQEAFAQSRVKPVAVLLYADWIDNKEYTLSVFRSVGQKFLRSYNFVELDITKNDAKFYNQRFDIFRGLPYIMMYKEGGKISRFIDSSCTNDTRCLESKLKSFIP